MHDINSFFIFYSFMYLYVLCIYNAGLFSDVLNYVLRMSKSSMISQLASSAEEEGEGGERVTSKSSRRKKTSAPHSEDSTDVGTVCVECFRFLKALAKDYTDVQER